MVIASAPLSSRKRPAPDHDVSSWGTAPPMPPVAFQRPIRIPYAHYALVYLDDTGKLQIDESPSIQNHSLTIFTPDVQRRFLDCLNAKGDYVQPPYSRPSIRLRDPSVVYGYDHSWSSGQEAKRRKASDQPAPADDQHAAGEDFDMVEMEIGNTDRLLAFYEDGLKRIQQTNCRVLAKAFIKHIEPKKQVKHPYNGRRPRGSPPGTKGNPELTKPPWWAPGIMHKEPDHIQKGPRICLLLHILRKLAGYGITSDGLKEVLLDNKRTLDQNDNLEKKKGKKEPSFNIMVEILRVRQVEERYERGEVDATTLVYVRNRNSKGKLDKEADYTSEADDDTDEGDEQEVPPPCTTPMDPSLSMDAGRVASLFPTVDSLSFEDPTRSDRPCYTTATAAAAIPAPTSVAPDFAAPDFSSPQNILRTPAAAATTTSTTTSSSSTTMLSPHDHASFDYLAAPAPQAMVAPPSAAHFDHWATPVPIFRQNIFGSVDYGSHHAMAHPPPAHPQSHPQSHPSHPSISFSMPLTQDPLGHPHHLSAHHTMADYSLKNPPFRTGSLGHPHHSDGLPLHGM
ncbi:hypothetical protein ASPZODRAFT_130232 [Penicilliopsis zonata CBS 506.65]|uniref:Subtelomeric hrmA-associated cluster protein AFUB-079030/YDR124W-like helical bundle domain-containing protein n=1 Tax=Penicilliopsis zonata CBS 506.65 TaxID=1073090 RepID=A0A1L9SME9_9EURO|nr:hypothetical protein ASPZODRAFT_130232 [Penicilliopsis zonata CBS 506.65]OJJ48271.1 hypothetical protein ASPZODRAFT_130232 [Penicilliopsis zonata CBS 506.65]